jgi:hypothetical protein
MAGMFVADLITPKQKEPVMSRITTKLLLSVVAVAALSAGAAEARYDASQCALDIRDSGDGSGFLTATAAPRSPGHYELTAYQITPTGDLDMSQSGPLRSYNGYWTTLTRSYLTTMYRGPAAYGPEAPFGVRPQNQRLNEGRYGVDVSVAAELRVYDDRGRLVCSDAVNAHAMPQNPPRRSAYLPLNPRRLTFSRFDY